MRQPSLKALTKKPTEIPPKVRYQFQKTRKKRSLKLFLWKRSVQFLNSQRETFNNRATVSSFIVEISEKLFLPKKIQFSVKCYSGRVECSFDKTRRKLFDRKIEVASFLGSLPNRWFFSSKKTWLENSSG